MRIIHTSDWHIGRFLNSYSLLKDQEYFLNWLILFLKEEKIDVLIVAGDIYNKASPSAACVLLLDEFFSKVVLELKKKVIIIAGNHDSPEKLGFSSKILERSGFFISTDLKSIKTITLEKDLTKVDITLMPYISPSMIKEQFKEEKISNFNEAVGFVYEKYLKGLNHEGFNILCAHGLFSYESENKNLSFCDSEIEIGGCDIGKANFFKNFSYVALGHLHKAQKVGKNARYSGSPIKYSTSEANNKKQLVLLEIDKQIKKSSVFFKPMRDLKIKKGEFNDILKEKSLDFVSVKLTDESFVLDPFNRLKQNYPNLLDIEFLNLKLNFKQDFKVLKKLSLEQLFEKFYKFVVGRKIKSKELLFLKKTIKQMDQEES